MLLPRGVYRANWLLAGCPVLVAIDHNHDILDWVVLRPQDDACTALEGLWAILEAQDPPEAPAFKLLGAPTRLTAG